MRRALYLLPLIPLLVGFRAWAETPALPDPPVADFTATASAHLHHLADLGVRAAGSRQERRAIDYVYQQFEQAKLEVSVEPFEFESLRVDQAVLHMGEHRFAPTWLVFNPYTDQDELVAEAVWAKPASEAEPRQLDGTGKILLTDTRDGFWRLMQARPLAVVCTDPKDSETIRGMSGYQARLQVTKTSGRMRSANVVARIVPDHPEGKEILLSAHLDSIGGPGANDNASGVAVLLALAQYLSQHRWALSCPIRFIAFGSEETGMLGSRAFVERHAKELPSCQLLCNMDSVGGGGAIMMDLPQASGSAPNAKHDRLPAQFQHRQLNGENWMLLEPSAFSLDYAAPAWLRDVVSECSRETGIPVRATQYSGSDHMSFAVTGLPITSVVVEQIGGTKEHTPEDTVDRVCPHSLAKVGTLVSAIVRRLMSRPAEP